MYHGIESCCPVCHIRPDPFYLFQSIYLPAFFLFHYPAFFLFHYNGRPPWTIYPVNWRKTGWRIGRYDAGFHTAVAAVFSHSTRRFLCGALLQRMETVKVFCWANAEVLTLEVSALLLLVSSGALGPLTQLPVVYLALASCCSLLCLQYPLAVAYLLV